MSGVSCPGIHFDEVITINCRDTEELGWVKIENQSYKDSLFSFWVIVEGPNLYVLF